MPISNQKEEIDSRILRLIGLDDVFDLDYETYLTLLKEAMVKSRMTKKTIPTEEVMLLTDEYKRVKSKKDKGRFNVQKKKITAGSFGVGDIKGKLIGKSPVKGLLPAQAIAKSPLTKSLEDNISAITSAIVSISETLKQQKKISDDTSAYDRRKSEQEKRGLAENKLEKRFEGLKKVAEKIIAPVKSLLDRILDFIGTVILGRIVYKIVEWMGDPKNASKVKSIIRFVKDWWPALLTSYVLFGTTFGKFVRGTVGLLGRFIFQIGRVAIPQLLKFVKSPVGIGLGLFTAGATIPAMMPGTVNEQERKTSKASGTSEDKIKALQQQKASLNFFDKLQGKGSEIDEQISYLQTGKTKSYGFSGGGAVNGYVSGERGVDKIPAMLSDGEFVMSRGAVDKYGVDTLESMNAAAGGTNKPKIVSGIPHAAGGGLIGGDRNYGYRDSNVPFTKDPVSAINRFLKYKFGVDVGKQATWGPPSVAPSVGMKSSNVSTGSLMSDPVGAVARIANNMGIKTPNIPASKTSGSPSSGTGNIFSKTMGAIQQKFGGPKGKPDSKNMFQEISEKLQGPGAATYRDAGSIYAKQMLGGMGGPISERDLSKESQQELQKAIQRAKKRTGSEISKAEAKIKELRAQGAKDGNPALETQKSFLKKLKAGGIRVQYADYADEKGKMSESAKNAKNILGQFWANERSKKEGGGYRIEDKYDFDKMKDPMGVLFGKGKTTQQRLQALHQMNPLKGGGDVDMVLGGKRTAAESWGLSGSKTLLGGMLGASGKPKSANQKALESKRPWWDKAGWFGGGSRVAQNQARIAKSKPKVKGVKPPAKSPVKVVRTKANTIGNGRGGGRTASTKIPNFNASTKGTKTKQQTLGVTR
jgi:hypothetical protein